MEELLDTDNMHGACTASVEFVVMMAKINRLSEAAHMLRYLDTTGMLDTPVWAAQTAEARTMVEAPPSQEQPPDDRQALEYMRRTLRQF